MSSENYMIQTIEQRQQLLKKLRDEDLVEYMVMGKIPCHEIPKVGRAKPNWLCGYNDRCRFQKIVNDNMGNDL